MVITIKRIILFLFTLILFFNCFSIIDSNAIDRETSYQQGSAIGIFYVRDVPIEIFVSYSYEENSDSSYTGKRIFRIDFCHVSHNHLDYSGALNSSASFTDSAIYVSVYGNLNHKSDSNRSFFVNETFILNAM